MKRILTSLLLIIVVVFLSFELTILFNTTNQQVVDQGVIGALSTNSKKLMEKRSLKEIRTYKGKTSVTYLENLFQKKGDNR